MNWIADDTADEAAELFPVGAEDLESLHAGLAAAAAEQELLDIAYRTIDTPLGPLLLAATETGLVRVAFECEGFDSVLARLAATISPRLLEAPQRLAAAAEEFDEYFSGERRVFDLPVDHRLSSGFRQLVQDSLPRIGYGSTQSYKDVAALVGRPRAVRAVGSACATNPLPVVLPCHRVLRTDGGLGGYIGGLGAKRALLDLESAG